MFVGSSAWDPVLIISQICVMQCLFYITLGTWEWILFGFQFKHLTTEYVFNWRHMDTIDRWPIMGANLLTAPCMAFFLLWVVERSKKVMDFSATCYIFHLIFCASLFSVPANLAWWTANSMGMLMMSVFGEWLCARRELRDIPLIQRPATRDPGPSTSVQMSYAAVSSSES